MLSWSKLRLRNKILIGFFAVIAIMIIITVVGINNFNRVNRSLQKTMHQNHSSIEAADNMQKAIDKQIIAINLFYGSDLTVKSDSLFTKAKNEFGFWYIKAKESAYTLEEKILLDSLYFNYTNFLSKTYSGKYLTNSGTINVISYENHNTAFLDDINIIKNQCYNILDLNTQLLKKTINETDDTIEATSYFLFGILAFGIIFSVYFSIKFSNYITEPIQRLVRSFQFVSAGNFRERLNLYNHDELGTVANEFNKMNEKLSRFEKLNLDKMQYEREKSDTIIESINEPVVITDQELNIFKANKEFENNFRTNNALNSNIKVLFNEKLLFEKIKKSESVKDAVIAFSQSDQVKYYKLIYSLISIPDSDLSGYVFVFHDITKFQEIDKLKSEFIGKVSHELKTPLTSMGMALGIMEDGIVGKLTKEQENIVSAIKEDYNRLHKLVHEILELTKLESTGLTLHVTKIDTKDLFENLIKNFYFQSEEKKLNIKYSIEKETETINADYDYLLRALENIVANSIKFTPFAGNIFINAYSDNYFNYIKIEDNGIGIQPEYLNKIFDKFTQLVDNIPGSVGLGLSITKEIIDLHKGEINVESVPNKYCTFTIKLNRY